MVWEATVAREAAELAPGQGTVHSLTAGEPAGQVPAARAGSAGLAAMRGGGVYNADGATLTSTTALVISFNAAEGNQGGNGGSGGSAISFQGGNGGGSPGGNGGPGGHSTGGLGIYGGLGGEAAGGGLFNDAGGTVAFKPVKSSRNTPASSFASNLAIGGRGGNGGNGGIAEGGEGGGGGANATGGAGGAAAGGNGGQGGGAGDARGGGISNMGSASFSGVTVNITANQSVSGSGGNGGNGTSADGGFGSNGAIGGAGGAATGGVGGDGGFSSYGVGGGIYNGLNTVLVINPRKGARKGSSQAKATSMITANQALSATGGVPGAGGSATPGQGGSPGGATGNAVAGKSGSPHPLSIGAGGGIYTVATATIDSTSITGNFASSLDNDVDGTIQS